MKRLIITILCAFFGLVSCTEKMKIEPQEGDQLVGISGSITDEYKKQEVIISRTESFYGGEPVMISNATVYVTDGPDTVWYEESEKSGYYLSKDDFAGQPNHTYYLSVDFSDHNGSHHYYAQSTMNENVDCIDSIIVKPWIFNGIEYKDMLGVYPYFQTTDDPNTYYMARIRVNDRLIGGDTLTKCELIEMMGYAGIYFNGPYMVEIAGEFPIYGLNQKKPEEYVNPGDTVTLDLWSIPQFYAGYIVDISSNTGTNPMMGTPSNVRTNIYPEGEAVGCFHASSLRQCSVIY